MVEELIRIIFLSTLAFTIAVLGTPLLTHFLYRYKLGKQIRDAQEAPIYAKLHAAKLGTPTMGGILVWGAMLVVIGLASFTPYSFLSRAETLLPLG
ncbi:MAG TPA: hypothetical protein DEG44_00310, partial [Candidatus Kerfeldbacteria bacterium]|nr:hypothetical protein [Candidatus Kerfeldbacteria bacterium]